MSEKIKLQYLKGGRWVTGNYAKTKSTAIKVLNRWASWDKKHPVRAVRNGEIIAQRNIRGK
jgi:hypothetical protein